MTLLHVVRIPDELLGVPLGASVRAGVAVARQRVDEVVARLDGVVASPAWVDVDSSPGRAIIARARQGTFDLVILGRPRRPGGSAAGSALVDYVLRRASCPVLTLPLGGPDHG